MSDNVPVGVPVFDIHELTRKLTTLADEIRDLDDRLLLLNRAIFGGRRVSDIPIEPPLEEDKQPTLPAPSEFNFFDTTDRGFTRAFYYMTYAREMVGQLETFSATSAKTRAQPAQGLGGSATIPGAGTFRR